MSLYSKQPKVTDGIPMADQGAVHVVVRRVVLVWKRLGEDPFDPSLIATPFVKVRQVGALGVGCLVGRLRRA